MPWNFDGGAPFRIPAGLEESVVVVDAFTPYSKGLHHPSDREKYVNNSSVLDPEAACEKCGFVLRWAKCPAGPPLLMSFDALVVQCLPL